MNNKVVMRVFKNKKLESYLLIMRKIENEVVLNEEKNKLLNVKNSQFHAIFERFRKIFREKLLKKFLFK